MTQGERFEVVQIQAAERGAPKEAFFVQFLHKW
jgi:hypothetical protein